jgi:collagenase-like PrtC family protease
MAGLTKIIAVPNHVDDIDLIIEKSDAILLGIKGMSVNCLDIEKEQLHDIVNRIKSAGKEVFVALNKNMHNNDLEELAELLKQCQELEISGLFYCDVAVLEICHNISLDLPLIWSAEHLVTNYHTINYWQSFGIKYAFLSNELTKDEIIDIKKNAKVPLIVQAFGYLPMYVSKRLALTNYLKFFKLKTSTRNFYLWKEDNRYPIVERSIGTEIYSSYILNAIGEYLDYKKNGIEYVLLSGFQIEIDKFLRIIDLFNIVDEDNIEQYKLEIDDMFDNSSEGFLHTETIYQVKKNEK